ncbi:hypothetical protein J437_LFUL005970 [Ladona fulva]|uniref:DNA-directed DNA polymerase n=1 Tax=Ladona fulva TaxID=123851 RepID=A0A8K0NZT3_LADFU|nr:hypothetical protein J437_LFUL005970 [Ladona fulva]
MNNAVFGKTIENVRKRMILELVTSERRLEKLVKKSTFLDRTIFSESLVAVHLRKSIIKMNKPIFIGFCVLDLSKTLMYDFHYRLMLPKYEKKLSLAYTDNDSLIYTIKTDDINEDMLENLCHSCYSVNNKKVIGKFKDECDGQLMTHFLKEEKKKKSQGGNKTVKEKSPKFDDYVCCLKENSIEFRRMNVIRSMIHELYTLQMNKVTLNAFDDKRHICDDGINTLPWGLYRIPRKGTWDQAFDEG